MSINNEENKRKEKEANKKQNYNFKEIFNEVSFLLILIPLVIAVFLSFNIIIPNAETRHIREDIKSYYNDNEVNLVLHGASLEQVEEYISKGEISSAIGIYKLEFDNNGIETNVLMIKDFDEINKSVYSDTRIIKSDDSIGNPIYIDYNYSIKHDLSVGDNHSIVLEGKRFEYTIARIYKTDHSINEGTLFMEYSNDLKEYIDSFRDGRELKYSWFEANSEDIDSTLESIGDSYLPEELRPACEEGNDCEEANKIFESGNYTSNVKLISDELEKTLQVNELIYSDSAIYKLFSIIGLVSLIVLLPVFPNKKNIVEEKDNGKNTKMKYVTLPIVCTLVVVNLSIILSVMINVNPSTIFVDSIIELCVPMILSILISALGAMSVNKVFNI